MALHVSIKLCVIGLVIASLITAFTAPPAPPVTLNLELSPSAELLPKAKPAASRPTPRSGPVEQPRFTLRATGYNSYVNQTDASPHVTSIGVKTHFGIIAVSRDLLSRDIPYGSLVRLVDLGGFYGGRGSGKFQKMLDAQGLFEVADTLNPRKREQIDVWFPKLSQARDWGVRRVGLEVARYGWDGPTFKAGDTSGLAFAPRFGAMTASGPENPLEHSQGMAAR